MHFSDLLTAFPEPPFKDTVRYVPMQSQDCVQLPKQYMLLLDCLPFAINAFDIQVNLSTIQWFRIATRPPETIGSVMEIGDNRSTSVFLAANKERLFIAELRIATGADVGTEAAYRCRVCRNVPPEPLSCMEATTIITAESEWPHMLCTIYNTT